MLCVLRSVKTEASLSTLVSSPPGRIASCVLAGPGQRRGGRPSSFTARAVNRRTRGAIAGLHRGAASRLHLGCISAASRLHLGCISRLSRALKVCGVVRGTRPSVRHSLACSCPACARGSFGGLRAAGARRSRVSDLGHLSVASCYYYLLLLLLLLQQQLLLLLLLLLLALRLRAALACCSIEPVSSLSATWTRTRRHFQQKRRQGRTQSLPCWMRQPRCGKRVHCRVVRAPRE